jgi:hypothetical protein
MSKKKQAPMMKGSKQVPQDRSAKWDSVPDLPEAMNDSFGKRVIDPSGKRKIVDKAGSLAKSDDGAVGMPGAKSSVENMDAAYERIAKLKKGKDGEAF